MLLLLQGVTRGYLKYLRIQGIGYRASLKDQTVTLKLGFSHDITYTLPPSLRAYLPEPTLLGLYGIDKNQVRNAAASSLLLLQAWCCTEDRHVALSAS